MYTWLSPRSPKGFTLVELVVVIAIIGILTSIIVVGLDDARKSGRDAKRVADLKNIQVALQLYYGDQSPPRYPTSLAGLEPLYMADVPMDPSNNAYFYTSIHAGPTNSLNCGLNLPVMYHLGAALETNNTSLSGQDSDWVDLETVDAEPDQDVDTYGVCTEAPTRFHGTAVGCVGLVPASGGADNCFDVTPSS